LHGPRIKITNSPHAPDSLGAIVLPAKLATEVTDVEVDASIEGGELSVKNILNQRLPGQDLSWSFEKRA
jgi:hypothetical protein